MALQIILLLLLADGKYNGVAPNAKIAFLDLSNGGGLNVLPANTMYPLARNAGARIHTNSWGSYYGGAGYYTGQDVDTYLYENQVLYS